MILRLDHPGLSRWTPNPMGQTMKRHGHREESHTEIGVMQPQGMPTATGSLRRQRILPKPPGRSVATSTP